MEKQLKRTSTSLTSSTSKIRKGDDVVEDMTMTEAPSNEGFSTVDEEKIKMARLAPLVFSNCVVRDK